MISLVKINQLKSIDKELENCKKHSSKDFETQNYETLLNNEDYQDNQKRQEFINQEIKAVKYGQANEVKFKSSRIKQVEDLESNIP